MDIGEQAISRRKFVAGASLAAATLGLAGTGMVGCAPNQTGEQTEATSSPTEDHWVPTNCGMCFNACAILAHVVDGVVVELKGDDRSPIGGGRMCGKGAAGLMVLYDPDRIKKPLKRTNPNKGLDEDPQWEEITYDEAYDLLIDNMKKTKESGGTIARHSLISSLPTNDIFYDMLSTLGLSEGAQPDICGAGIHTAYEIFTGTGNGMPDYEYCNYLLQFGTQAGIATRHGLNICVEQFAQRRADGLKLINFDPHMSASAEKADLWVPIRPGTDAAAALALSYVLVHELDLIDRAYLTKRTNGPALVDAETGRVVRENGTNKALYMDADGTIKPYDKATDPQLEGTFDYEGKSVTTGFSLYKEHIKQYTPEYQESITTVPADTIRQVAKEFGEAACIGQTKDIDGKTLPYRPVCADLFSGTSRHKHAFLTQWSIMQLNVLVGSANSVGGFLGFSPACNGWTDDSDYVSWRPGVWEEDGFTDHVQMFLGPKPSISHYKNIKENDYTPVNSGMAALQPLALTFNAHFYFIAQAHPELYHTQPARMLVNIASSPLTFWGNHDEQAEVLKAYDYVVNIDIYLNSSTYFADLVIPEACYLERTDPLPNSFLGHVAHGGMGIPWSVNMRQAVIEPLGGARSGLQICADVADRAGVNKEFISNVNWSFRVKDENSLPFDQKLDVEKFCDSVYRSVIDDEHGFDWFKEHGTYNHPRDVDEVYIWSDDAPGKVPLYWDFMLEAKDKVEAKVEELGIPWETQDYVALPQWMPCCEYEVEDPDFDMLPIYWTNAINVDAWTAQNAWINELNERDPYGYTIEMNSATAAAKGIASGDAVRLTNRYDVSVEGRVAISETVHPECISVLGGHWNMQSRFTPISQGKGVAVNHLIPGTNPDRFDHVSMAFDQCVRVKVEKL